MTVEIELKLAIAPGAVRRLRGHPLLKAVRPSRRKLYGIYFDTPDFDLFRRKGAFRLRREGYHWVQTVKLDRGSVGGLSMRPEYEVQLAGNQPDFAALPDLARAALTPAIEAALAPVFVTDFHRTTWLLERHGGTVEVALDIGHIRAGDTEQSVAEVELELKSGDSAVLFEVAHELLRAVSLVPEYRSKALRGYQLLGVWRDSPCKAVQADIKPGMPAAEAWRRSLQAALEQLSRNLPGLIGDDDPEYLHQTRVAVRRLRTLLSLGKSLGLGDAGWRDELRWFMGELSGARDLDVLVTETLAGVRAGLPDPERLDSLMARAEKAREQAGRRARAAAGDPRLSALIFDMGSALLAERNDGPALSSWAEQMLAKRWRGFRKQVRDFPRLDAAGRHQARILAKRLRYAGEAFADLYGRRAGRFLKKVAEIQGHLGAANDIVVAHRLLAELNHDGRMRYAVGLSEGFIAAHALAGAEALASQVDGLVRSKPFWRKG